LALLSEVSSIFGGCEDINRYVAVLFGNIMSHTCHQNVSEEVDEFSLNTIGTRLRSLASNVLYIFQQQSQGKGVTMTKQSDMTDVMKLFNLSMRAENPVEDRHADDREILDCAIHMLRQHGVYSEAICCDCCELLDMLLVVDDSNLASPLLLDRDRGQSLCKSLMELLITINKDHQCKPSYRKAVLKMLTILQTCLPEILEPIAFCGETDPITSVVEAEYWLNRSTNLLKLVLLQSKEDAELVPRLLHVVHEVNIHTMCIVKPSCHPDGKLVIGELLELIQKQGNPQSVSKISRRSRADGFINVKQDVQQQETKVLLMLKVFQTFTVWIVTQDLADVTNLFLQSDERNIFWQLLSSYPENEFIVCTICDIFLNMLMSLEKTDQHGIGKSKFWSMWLQSLLQFLKRHKSSVAVSTSILKLMSHILQDLAKAEWSTEEMEFYCNPQTIIILFLALKSHSLHQKDIIICCLSCIHHLLSTSNLMSKEPHLSAFQRNYLVDILKYYDRLDGRVSEEVKCILAIVGSDECEESSGDQVSSKNEVTKSNTQSLSPTLPIPSKAAIASNEIEIISPIDSKVYKGKWRETQVAIKLQSANGDKIQAEEFEMLSSSRHPRLLSVYGRCESLPTSILTSVSGGIVMEYMDKGDLRSLLNSEQGFASLTIEKMLRIAVDISEGMNFLHASNKIHRCLKTGHILLDEHYRAKISGFGEERTNELDKSPNKFLFTFKNRCIDVYDFGVILWELLTGKVPWEAKTMKQGKLTLTGKETKDSPAQLVTLMNHCMDCVASTSISKTNSTMSSSISGTESLTFKEIHMVLQDLLQDEIKQMEDRQRAVPDGFICPITQDIMKDPVMLVGDGHSYERKAILEWLQRTNRSPLTNEVLPAVNVTSTNTNAPSTSGGTANTLVVMENYALKSSIQSFLANQQLLHR
jgi:serine/threonine protein kinase